MSTKRKINENYPKYGEYISKCRKISEDEEAEVREMRKQFGDIIQLDGPETSIRKKYWEKVKLLKDEYSFLFYEEDFMKKMVEQYISRLDELKLNYNQSESKEEFNDGCNCAIDCINDGIDTRISILRDLELDKNTTIAFIESLFDELIDTLIDTLKSCMKNDHTLFYQGFNKIVSDFCIKAIYNI